MVSPNRNMASIGFPRGLAKFGAFDAVRDGVSYEMNQRVRNVLNDVVVEFGLRALEHKLYGLPEAFAASLTVRERRVYRLPIGTMRAAVISSCK